MEGIEMKRKCGICHKYVKVEKVKKPRSKGEVNFVCKTHGIINQYI
jgi:hypothetical protein